MQISINEAQERAVSLVNEALNEERLCTLYPLFSAWEQTAYEQGIKARNDQTMAFLKGKLSEEYVESRRALKKYTTAKTPFSHAKAAMYEIGDLANMALIIIPGFYEQGHYLDDGHIPLYRMMTSFATRAPDFRIRLPYSFDAAKDYPQQELFSIWLKTTDFISLTNMLLAGDDKRLYFERTMARVDHNLGEILNGLDQHLEFDKSLESDLLQPNGQAIALMGDCVTNAFFLASIITDLGYEDLFISATWKMHQRDARYHEIERGRQL